MPRGDRTKAPAFRLWKAGKSLREIQDAIRAISRTKPSSVAGWVRDWERGSQGTWTPRVRIVLIALSLLASAATASAECAWVLWGQGTELRSGDSGSFAAARVVVVAVALGGWPSRDACEQERLKREQTTPQVGLFTCLPDTVDPRGPKGK